MKNEQWSRDFNTTIVKGKKYEHKLPFVEHQSRQQFVDEQEKLDRQAKLDRIAEAKIRGINPSQVKSTTITSDAFAKPVHIKNVNPKTKRQHGSEDLQGERTKFTVQILKDDLALLNELVDEQGYSTRSDLVRKIIRDYLKQNS